MADKPKYYWDACSWIALIQHEPKRFDALNYLIEQAKNDKVEIWTSMFTLAEVFKRPCDGELKGLLPEQDQTFVDFILQDFVQRVQVDYDVGALARTLLRRHPDIKKPQDAIHLATALLNNIDELHTYDRENLIGLSGKIPRVDGKNLLIGNPPAPPPPPTTPAPLWDAAGLNLPPGAPKLTGDGTTQGETHATPNTAKAPEAPKEQQAASAEVPGTGAATGVQPGPGPIRTDPGPAGAPAAQAPQGVTPPPPEPPGLEKALADREKTGNAGASPVPPTPNGGSSSSQDAGPNKAAAPSKA